MNKVYVVVENESLDIGTHTPSVNILGVYDTKEKAEQRVKSAIEYELDNYEYVQDEGCDTRLFLYEQGNWENTIEYEVIEREVQ